MGLRQFWNGIKNKLNSSQSIEDELVFGVKNETFILKTMDGFTMTVCKATVFESLRLKNIITTFALEDPLGEHFGEPILLNGITKGKHLKQLIEWCEHMMAKEESRENPQFFVVHSKVFAAMSGIEFLELRDAADYLDIPLLLNNLSEVFLNIQMHDKSASEEVIRRAKNMRLWVAKILDVIARDEHA